MTCFFSVACGAAGEDYRPPMLTMGLGGAAAPDAETSSISLPESCDDGDEARCSVVVHQASGVTSCFPGVTYCIEGAWTECFDPETGQVGPLGDEVEAEIR